VTPRRLVLFGCALLAVVVFAMWTTTSEDYLYVPNEARPVANKVEVGGETEENDVGGIYFIDVKVRKARWLEQVLPFVRPEGASLVPAHAVTPPGQTFAQWRLQARADMERSEQIAAAVAFREAGLEVDATPRGALVEAVAIDVPAAKTLRGGDVIVQAAGKPVLTPGGLVEAVGGISPGETVRLRLRRSGKLLERTVRTVSAPDDADRAIIGISVSQDARIELPRKVTIDLGDVGGASAGLPFALEVYQQLGRDVDRGYRVAATSSTGRSPGWAGSSRRRWASGAPERICSSSRLGITRRPHAATQGRCASSLWRVFDRRCACWKHSLGNHDLQGFRLSGRHPQFAVISCRMGVARHRRRVHNGRCSQGICKRRQRGRPWASALVRRATTATSGRRVSAHSPGTRRARRSGRRPSAGSPLPRSRDWCFALPPSGSAPTSPTLPRKIAA
jgi:PDZ domain-containing protein